MGLFSKKPKELEYDAAECTKKKERMREMFNEAIEEGDSYSLLHATQTSSKFERGFVFDTNTTTFYHYILGYRTSDNQIALVQIDRGLTQHSEGVLLDMDEVVEVTYNPKYTQACLTYRKGYGSYGEILDIGDTGSKTAYGIPNTVQPQEREAFLDFLEAMHNRLAEAGFKQDKWKR
ncbi:MAG: hypothetical protein K2O03_15465 [Lachnospiraceae bacterium]|nr:hypothetical protein [Lachnospiraceae bacterium]